jgi:hypothetical protein
MIDTYDSPTILVSTLNRLSTSPSLLSMKLTSCFNALSYVSLLSLATILNPLVRISSDLPKFARPPIVNIPTKHAAANDGVRLRNTSYRMSGQNEGHI